MVYFQESRKFSRNRCKFWIMALIIFSYAKNQKMERYDLLIRNQIPMALRQKPFQAKNLAKHWNNITNLCFSISIKNKIKGVHSYKN